MRAGLRLCPPHPVAPRPSQGRPLTPNPACSQPTEDSNKKHPFPCPTSYRTALTYYLDITNPPRTNVLYELAQYASEPSEQEQLRKMASSSGEGKVGLPPTPQRPPPPQPCTAAPSQHPRAIPQAAWAPLQPCPLGPRVSPTSASPQELYLSWVVEARRHILAILQDYSSLRPPIDHLCELLPRLQARYYSIASSSKVWAPGLPAYRRHSVGSLEGLGSLGHSPSSAPRAQGSSLETPGLCVQ